MLSNLQGTNGDAIHIKIVLRMGRFFLATLSLVFVAVELKRVTVMWRFQNSQHLVQSFHLGDATNTCSSYSGINGRMYGNNSRLTKCFVVTTNSEPIVM